MSDIENDKLSDNMYVKVRMDVNTAKLNALISLLDNTQKSRYQKALLEQIEEVKEHYLSLYGNSVEDFSNMINEFDRALLASYI